MNVASSTAVIETSAKYDPDPFRKRIVDGGGEVFAKGLIEALEPSVPCGLCKRPRYAVWAYRTFAKIAKLTNTEPQVLVAILQQYGIRDESEMRALVESGRRMEQLRAGDMDLRAAADDATEVLRLALQAHPELRANIMARLTSTVSVVEAQPNGNGAHE